MRKRMMLRAGIVVCAVVATPIFGVVPSQAVPISEFTGHSSGLISTVNFAVLPPGDPLITVLAPMFRPAEGTTAGLRQDNFTYLYQVTNTFSPTSGPRPAGVVSPARINLFSAPGAAVRASGVMIQAGFHVDFLDQGKVLNGSGIRSECSFPRCGGDGPGGALDGAKGFGIALQPNTAGTPTATNFLGVSGSPRPTIWAFLESGGRSALTSGISSPVIGYQSPNGPILSGGGLTVFAIDYSDSFVIPGSNSSAPEPATLLLVGSGFVGMAAWRRKQRRAVVPSCP